MERQGEVLFYGGISVLILAAVLTVVALVVLNLVRRRLKARLEQEFGKKRHER